MEKEDYIINQLLELAEEFTANKMNILGEGNISGMVDDDVFYIKASGISLVNLGKDHLVPVKSNPFLKVLEGDQDLSDSDVEQLLLTSRIDSKALKPSVETLFHAWLLNLPSVKVVGHCHPPSVNKILCSPQKEDYAKKRLFPDQIVYCGAKSVLIDYVDPGLVLARKIVREVQRFIKLNNELPRLILLENHGLIAIGEHYQDVLSATLMAEKSAEIFIGAATLGGPVFMKDVDVMRIDKRKDEDYRRKISKVK